MLHKEFSRFYRRWINRIRREKMFRVTRRPSTHLTLTQVEDRVTPALNPQTLITKAATPITFTHSPIYTPDPGAPPALGHSSQVAADPNNSARQVAFSVVGNGLVGIYSVDGGNTWSDFYDTVNTVGSAVLGNIGFSNRIRDTSVDEPGLPTEGTRFDAVTPSVAWDRNGMVYLVRVERTNGVAIDGNNPGSGVIALDAFDFNGISNIGGFPTRTTKQRVIYRWQGSDDAAYNPVVAVNNNIASYTDPVSGTVLQDRDAGRAVYVAWNTNAATSGNRTAGVDFINATTFLAGSVDKGNTFTTPIQVGGNSVNGTSAFGGFGAGYNTGNNTFLTGDGSLVAPQIVFSAPGAPVAGVAQPATMSIISAQKTVGRFILDQSTPGTVGTAKLPFSSKTFSVVGTPTIVQSTDGAVEAITPDIKVAVSIPAGLTAADLVTDVNVRLVAQHGNLDQLNVELFNNVGDSIVLLRNRTLSNGTARPNYGNGLPQGVPASQDLGRIFGPAATVPTPASPPGLVNPGIFFDDAAPRPINDTGVNDAPYIGSALGLGLSSPSGRSPAIGSSESPIRKALPPRNRCSGSSTSIFSSPLVSPTVWVPTRP
jgi:hypothetical protein